MAKFILAFLYAMFVTRGFMDEPEIGAAFALVFGVFIVLAYIVGRQAGLKAPRDGDWL